MRGRKGTGTEHRTRMQRMERAQKHTLAMVQFSVPSLNISRLSDADAADIRSAFSKHRALGAASNGLESGAKSPLAGASRWLARRTKNLALSSEPGSPKSPKPSWNPRRMLSDLLFPPAALRHASEQDSYSYGPEIDYAPDNRCLRHGAFDCSSCVQVATPLATHKEAVLVLRQRFLTRTMPPRRHSTGSTPPRPLSPGNDSTHVSPSVPTSPPPILSWPAGHKFPVSRVALRAANGGDRQRAVSWDADIEAVRIIPGRQERQHDARERVLPPSNPCRPLSAPSWLDRNENDRERRQRFAIQRR
ncbi:hypothetical protein T484DRAFT_3646282 [Baffinella frigidus]|nr:hypothetical protein T484DRAFT_3646282 [Cryptophyta sp. CCMP2293]